jgi:twitching motility two-component system response regulator PilG
MNDKCTISVAFIGLTAREQNVLLSIFKLSSCRPRIYTLAPIPDDSPPGIVLVDADDPAAMTLWHDLCAREQSYSRVPAVMVSQHDRRPTGDQYHIKRPLLASRLLHFLDQLPHTAETTATVEVVQQPRALVVDDSVTMRRQVELALQQCGIATDSAENGEQALASLKPRSAYDLIFLDVILPGVDGYTICKAIKKDKRYKQTPVIMLTGKDSSFDQIRGKLAGCDTYLIKPVTQTELQGVVQHYLAPAGHHAERSGKTSAAR